MSLLTYEFKRADHAGEISQFRATLPILQRHFQGRNEVVLYLSGKLNINGVDIDGLIIKEDAIVLVEFKNYCGEITARANGDWFHGTERINGGARKRDGSFKSVFEQLQFNRRNLREGLSHYITDIGPHINPCNDIQALVVFSAITKLDLDPEFTWGRNSWVNVTDIEHIGEKLDTIRATTKKGQPFSILPADIFSFIRRKQLDERYILLNYSDVNVLPPDLYHEDRPHNGDDFSPNALLAKVTAEKDKYLSSLNDATEMIQEMMRKMESMAQEKDVIIQQQKAELLQIKAEQLATQKREQEIVSHGSPAQALMHEEQQLIGEIEAVEAEIRQIDQAPVQEKSPAALPVKKRFGMKEKVLKSFDVKEGSMDDDQLDLIERTLDKSMIVAGCAGSGKSVIAMAKAQQIIDQGGDVILIAYTKSLNRYMSQGKKNALGQRFYYYWEWVSRGMPKADYVIVDEIQDFDQNEIQSFIDATRKCFFFFGDTAQSIYNFSGKRTMTIDEIATLTKIAVSRLYNNYRLPKPVAKITQGFLGLSEDQDQVRAFSESLYVSKETTLPIFLSCPSDQNQIDQIVDIIRKEQYKNVGILVPDNDLVLEIMNKFTAKNFVCEFKYNSSSSIEDNRDTLDFRTNHPKLMTYHSAKGLQFETVILPFYRGARNVADRKALYVAMTRTYRNLYVLYSGDLAAPLSNVPERLFDRERHKRDKHRNVPSKFVSDCSAEESLRGDIRDD